MNYPLPALLALLLTRAACADVPYVLARTLGAALPGIPGHPFALAVTRDGTLLVASASGVALWDATQRKKLAHLEDMALNIRLTPDERFLVVAGSKGAVGVWSIAERKRLWTRSPGGDHFDSALALDPSGRTFFSVSNASILRWDLETGKQLETIATKGAKLLDLATSRDGRDLYSIHQDGRLMVHAGPARTPRTFAMGTGPHYYRRLFVVNDGLLLSGFKSAVVDPATGRRLRAYDAVVVLEGRSLFGVVGTDVVELDRASGAVTRRFKGHADSQIALAMDARRERLYSGALNEVRIREWDLRSGTEVGAAVGLAEHVTALALSADGQRVAAGDFTGKLMVWNARNGQVVRSLDGHAKRILCLLFSPDGSRLFSGGDDGQILQWDVDSGRQLGRATTRRMVAEPVYSLALLPDGRTLLAGGLFEGLVRWGLADDRVESVPTGVDWLYAIVVPPAGDEVIGLPAKETVRSWRPDGAPARPPLEEGGFSSCAVTPNGKYLYVGKPGLLGRFALGERAPRFQRLDHHHGGFLGTLALMNQGRELVALEGDEVHLFDAERGRHLASWPTPVGLRTAASAPGAHLLATGHASGQVVLWERGPDRGR